MSLTKTFLGEIENELNNEHFLSEDFNIEIEDYASYIELNINYLYLPQYKFEGKVYKDEEKFNAEI